MERQLIKGNEAIVKGAILAGCRAYYGYPITPASEIAQAAALYMPLVGGTFLQAESEIAAINMVYGASGTGQRVMTASSSPGISLKQEGISYIAGAELPCVIVDVMRGGPGLGNIAPEQSDYHQMVKGGGHGNYKNIVLAPNSAQEMCDLTMLAFELSDKYRNPAVVLADGFIGQMMEPVVFPKPVTEFPEKKWAIRGTVGDKRNLISSIELDPDDLERHNRKLQQKYAIISQTEVRFQEYELEDAEYILVAFGIVSRLVQSAVDTLREDGVKVGMLRPITLMPFPTLPIEKYAANERVKFFSVFELNNGQMVEDVRLAVNGKKPVKFYGRMGGNVPTIQELVDQVKKQMREL
ncbi:MAG TPA: 3-methyl-2-oxobutanoate dehydrogenase subunit beta [Candidatus Marinimicrobia bacterium]|nr:MAG: 3-methyl-2-oxobutanoate dehydrogenase subunit VorB [Candidatus Marinimicrobia bacterium CG1_02_48_14]PJA51906.1 MAG: 3-methyl-2-oxobutanoate dehydrogenase subunit VorB [Candidatus Marinimicrobia bacterium CG_4_9_14_3_um_filter_48_9]HCW77230.1 3-methyl-2-oxobutanoate dehydrogenase subunit beta [Candidatus Neomarinimicrobiota bacterium]